MDMGELGVEDLSQKAPNIGGHDPLVDATQQARAKRRFLGVESRTAVPGRACQGLSCSRQGATSSAAAMCGCGGCLVWSRKGLVSSLAGVLPARDGPFLACIGHPHTVHHHFPLTLASHLSHHHLQAAAWVLLASPAVRLDPASACGA